MPTITYDSAETAAVAHFAAQTAYGSAGAAPVSAQLRAVEEIRPLASILAKHKAGIEASVATADLSEAIDDRVNALLVAGTNVTLTYNDGAGTLTIDAAGGGTIDGSGTGGRGARWTDTDTLAAGGVQDDGTSVGINASPASDVVLTLLPAGAATTLTHYKGVGGVANPQVRWEDATGGIVNQTFADGAMGWAAAGNAPTVLLDPGYPDSQWKTHPTAAAQISFMTHDGSDYVTVLRVTNGKAQLWDGSALVDVSIGAADSAGAGFRLVRVPN